MITNFKEYQKRWQLLRKIKRKVMMIEQIDMNDVNNLINKIELQRGFVDYIDCYRIINIYEQLYYDAINIDAMDPMDQIVYMYSKIKDYKKEDIFICNSCNNSLPSSCFSKYKASKSGFNHMCKSCAKEYRLKLIEEGRISDRSEYNKKWRIENKDKCEKYIKNRKKV